MIASAAFWSHWGWAAATAVLGFVFFGLVFRQYVARRRLHQLAWAIGLLFYALAAASEAWSESSGEWDPTVYRIYIVLAASLVGFLGLGSLYLVARKRRWGDVYFVFLIVCMAIFFVGTFTVQLDTAKLVPGITVGGQALGPSLSFPRVMSLPINISGTLLLFGGAAWSVWRFARRREFGYRAWANVLIAAGAALLAFLGSRARLGDTAGLYPAEMVAAALMLAGFLLAGTLDKGVRASAPASSRRCYHCGGVIRGAMKPLRTALRGVALTVACACLVASAPGVASAGAATASMSALGTAGQRTTASNTSRNWWFIPKGAHRRPGIPSSAARLLHRFGGLWIGGRHERVVYLTFDEADELGTTSRIIGILERAHVKASFFLTGRYIRANRGVTRRLAAHGHLLCNHSWSHADMVVKARSRSAFTRELRATERACHAATGGKLARFFRPPFGTYSARSLLLAEQLGYATVFWSFAHYDYDKGAQPPVSVTLRRILSSSYPGAIYLLHASSQSNVNALARAIHGLKAQGYGFATLDELR